MQTNDYETPIVEYPEGDTPSIQPRCSVGAGAMLAILLAATDVAIAVNYLTFVNALENFVLWSSE